MQQRQKYNLAVTAPLPSPFIAFAIQAVVLGGAVVVLSAMVLPTYLWVLFAYSAMTLSVGHSLASGHYCHDAFGLCNTVTLVRATLVSFLIGTVFALDTVSPWLVCGIATFALVLDGVDGWLARRAGLQSDFGARFDVETDAALAAILAVWLMVSGTTGLEVLILGFIRYGFVLAGWAVPRLRAELPHSFRRKLICVIQMGALILLTVPGLSAGFVMVLSIGASLALCYSFAVDLHWLLRRDA